jgi:hypothetical protein
MVAKWFAWWNSLGLLGFLDYIREERGLGSCGCRVVIRAKFL